MFGIAAPRSADSIHLASRYLTGIPRSEARSAGGRSELKKAVRPRQNGAPLGSLRRIRQIDRSRYLEAS
jgi:hypothetical protein